MNNSRPIVNISLLLGTIIAVSAFFLVFNNIPVQALHKEQQLLESFDDLADFANAVKNGDEEIEEIPIQSMKEADIYDLMRRAWGSSFDRIFICIGAGGGTGAGTFNPVLTIAKQLAAEMGIPQRIGAIIAMPKTEEGARVANNTINSKVVHIEIFGRVLYKKFVTKLHHFISSRIPNISQIAPILDASAVFEN